jgi:hypothetical protein
MRLFSQLMHQCLSNFLLVSISKQFREVGFRKKFASSAPIVSVQAIFCKISDEKYNWQIPPERLL